MYSINELELKELLRSLGIEFSIDDNNVENIGFAQFNIEGGKYDILIGFDPVKKTFYCETFNSFRYFEYGHNINDCYSNGCYKKTLKGVENYINKYISIEY